MSGDIHDAEGGRGIVARIDRLIAGPTAKAVVLGMMAFVLLLLMVPIVFTFVASFAESAAGALPSGFVTLDNWRTVLGLGDYGVQTSVGPGLAFSAMLATGGMVLNIIIGVPIAYALTRYNFFARDWINAIAILPLVPGIILGVAFLRTYPENAGSALGLIVGYALLKSPYMVLTVQSSFQSMDLQQLEESSRSLGASWPRTFLTVIVPNAKDGIIAGSIICWTLAAAEFNFTYMVYARGPRPFSLFLFENISNAPYLQSAAAISVYFLIVVAAITVLQLVGNRGFSTSSDR
ncbi:ABC transporter permease subunit [Natrialba sp. INN-245]|uniref:ABC transporter permease n=1 Tax=Natrialba sp. INN-245 TaxID=2690967 RepID=UPI001312E9CD|nr:ABC transporter permease subunit [Natrialba sp. INN-245]MWV41517.1 ABC transporter permease subunit [Natrialba sp. INN-245]